MSFFLTLLLVIVITILTCVLMSGGFFFYSYGYLSSCLEYIKDPIEKKIKENTIRSFLAKLENESDRQHVVLEQLQSALMW